MGYYPARVRTPPVVLFLFFTPWMKLAFSLYNVYHRRTTVRTHSRTCSSPLNMEIEKFFSPVHLTFYEVAMRVSILYISLLVISPILAMLYAGCWVALGVLVSSVLTVRSSRKLQSLNRRMICLAVLINQLVVTHSMFGYHMIPVDIVLQVPALELKNEKGESDARPFVSIVLFETDTSTHEELHATLRSIEDNTSTVLAAEVVVPTWVQLDSEFEGAVPRSHSLSSSTDFIVFVCPSAQLNVDWLHGMVREFFANDMRMVVPVVSNKNGNKITAAMIGSSSGKFVPQPYLEALKDVPVIPLISSLGVSRKIYTSVPRFSDLVRAGKVVELSLRAWFCFEGIHFTRFTTVKVESTPATNWRLLEGEAVDERITGCPRDIVWFYSRFKEEDPDSQREKFVIKNGATDCVGLDDSRKLVVAKCDLRNPKQIFSLVDEDRAIRSETPGNQCFDAGSADMIGRSPAMYHCMRKNRNQMFTFQDGRLMWGSFCLDVSKSGKLIFQYCKGVGDGVIQTQKFIKHVINSKS